MKETDIRLMVYANNRYEQNRFQGRFLRRATFPRQHQSAGPAAVRKLDGGLLREKLPHQPQVSQ